MKIKGYIPDFKLAFEHFCIHTGGRGVIEEIEKQLQLAPANVQPSKDTLYRYGNTSSSSIWCAFQLAEYAANMHVLVFAIASNAGSACLCFLVLRVTDFQQTLFRARHAQCG